jgi:hypothetical protein
MARKIDHAIKWWFLPRKGDGVARTAILCCIGTFMLMAVVDLLNGGHSLRIWQSAAIVACPVLLNLLIGYLLFGSETLKRHDSLDYSAFRLRYPRGLVDRFRAIAPRARHRYCSMG